MIISEMQQDSGTMLDLMFVDNIDLILMEQTKEKPYKTEELNLQVGVWVWQE